MGVVVYNSSEKVISDDKDIDASENWMRDFLCFNKMMEMWISGEDAPDIKIALLDTGIDALHPFIQSRWSGKHSEEDHYYDFVEAGTQGPIDEDGHGTHCAGSILKVAPRALLYVARVCKTQQSSQKDGNFANKVAQVSLCIIL